jgi:hypothetical protein
MINNFQEFSKFGTEQFEAASSAAASLAKGYQTIAAEATVYSKRSLESSSTFLEKVAGAKSLEHAIQIQSDYAKSAYEDFIAQAGKIGQLYASLAKETFKPVESAIAKVHATTAPGAQTTAAPEARATEDQSAAPSKIRGAASKSPVTAAS